MKYNYEEAVYDDALEAAKEYIKFYKIDIDDISSQKLYNMLEEALWIDDSVTGNGSGSYTFNAYEAEQNLVGNKDLLEDALEEFGEQDVNILEKGAEWCDVSIRCYLLPEAIQKVIEELKNN